MGEVYRARDTRLERTVAIKILPAQFSSDPVRKQRFEREAKTISSLNHPHICTLHDIGSQDGVDYLVMECVEGETLAKRLEKGPLPLDQVLRFGSQIADALDKAHRAGIVHRDLKPGNIMLTEGGAKLLDFGLAKPAAALVSGATMTAEAARTTPMTQEGTIVGTFQYMSPEQVEGKELDGRSDIFSLGAVLYEMVTGKRAFEGKSQLSVASAILEKEPAPITSTKPLTPPTLDHAIRKCLAKGPDERWQSASDLASQLKWIGESSSHPGAPAMGRAKTSERIAWLVLTASALLAAIFGFLYGSRAPEKGRVVRSYIKAMPGSSFVFAANPMSGFALSPDGLHLAYVAQDSNGKAMLWVRPLDSLQAQPLAGTQDANSPFWSPDSQNIGFFADGKLKRIGALGGPTLTLCDAPNPRGGTWNQEDVILFSPSLNAPLFRVMASGGTAAEATTIDSSKGEITHRWPQFLPDGRHFLYLAGALSREKTSNSILVGSLDSRQSKPLMHTHANGLYASGHLLFLRENTLMAQALDVKRLELIGTMFPVADPVQEEEITSHSIVSVSQSGMLAYLEGTGTANRELIWVDRTGKKVGEVPGTDAYTNPRISPDGKRVLYSLISPGFDIWSYDLARGVKTRLTFGSGNAQANIYAVWSPDGRRIAYTSVRGGKFGIYEKSADGSGNEEVLLEGAESTQYTNDWSQDGKFLAFHHTLEGAVAISVLPLGGPRKPNLLLHSQSTMFRAAFSPDGKWVAYCSNESGDLKVYVVPFPGPGGKWEVSLGGGDYPRWRRDGKELFYLSLDNKIMAVDVKACGSSFAIGAVRPLFETRANRSMVGAYDVSADGQRFVIAYEPGQPNAAITLVANWDAELKKK
jgi:serine/threonine protein kinase